MKRKVISVIAGMALCVAIVTGCGADAKTTVNSSTEAAAETSAEAPAEVTTETNAETNGEASTETVAETSTEPSAETPAKDTSEAAEEPASYEAVDVKVGSLKGPTSMGLVYLMDQVKNGEAANNYEFKMAAAADELLPAMISGELDIVLVPANVASILYNKTQGGVTVIDINTLGVLYMVSGDTSIQKMEDLKGKTIYMTGKGTTPDYVLNYLLTENGLTADDVSLEYKSEATEVAAMLAEDATAIGVLPQPFVTAACAQNEKLSVVMDLTKEWAAVQGEGGSSLVTGVTVVRNEFLQENGAAVDKFLEEHAASAAYANENVAEAAVLVAEAGIIEKAPVAEKAMPKCNITYIDGEEMMTALSGYLEVLYNQDASSVGGNLPGEDFYYLH